MILKTQPVTKRNTYFCGDIQSNLTGQRSNSITIQVSDVQRKVQSECFLPLSVISRFLKMSS